MRPRSSRPLTSLLLPLLLLAALGVVAQAQEAGAIRGTVYDFDSEVPLADVRVSVVGGALSTLTNVDGNFVFNEVSPGSYTLSIGKPGYERTVRTNVVVGSGRVTDLDRINLYQQVVDLPPMVVTPPELPENTEFTQLNIRADALATQDNISAEIMKASGASDVAAAITNVVGVSARDGKYATVRGLSDRYTGTTLNGIRVPSPDPRRRAVQVDLFPTATVDSVSVSKTFTPDLQGDFTGGGVDIRTKGIPDAPILDVSISGEYNSLASNIENFLTYEGGGVDAWAAGANDRAIPIEALGPFPARPAPVLVAPEGSPALETARFYDMATKAFDPVIGTTRTETGLNKSYSLVAGNRFELGGPHRLLGLLGAVTYSLQQDFYNGGINNQGVVTSSNQPITILKAREDSQGTDELLIGALANAVLQINENHDLSLKWILNKGVEDQARFQLWRISAETQEHNQSLTYTERAVSSLQLHGNHAIPWSATAGPVELNWRVAKNETSQDQPDVRFFRNTFNPATATALVPSNSTDAGNTRRIWRLIDEENEQGAVDVILPFSQWTQTEGRIKLGAYAERTDRDYDQRSFTYNFTFSLGSPLNPVVQENRTRGFFTQDEEGQLWTDVFLDEENLGLSADLCMPGQNPFSHPCAAPNQLLWTINPLGDDVDYTAHQEIDAYYWMVELPLVSNLRLIGGARHESTSLEIVPLNQAFGTVEIVVVDGDSRVIVEIPQDEARTEIEQSDVLPAAGLIWDFVEKMNLRASWSETIARPTFRELAPVITEEFLDGDEFLGNPFVEISSIENWDLRWEWFRREGEVLAASLFYKEITNPIEYISYSTGNRSFVQPVNFPEGEVSGWEVEVRTALDFIAEPLKDLNFGFNYADLSTEVTVPEQEQVNLAPYGLDEPKRQLQGQPEYLLNANLSYDPKRLGASFSLFYTLSGDTLLTGAARGVDDGNPNVVEAARGNLNFRYGQEFRSLSNSLGGDLSLSLRVRNILQDDRETRFTTPFGETALRTVRETALKVSLGVSFAW